MKPKKTAKAYFKALKIINSVNHLSCDLWKWLFKLRNTKMLTYEQFLTLVEVYDSKNRQENNKFNQTGTEKINSQVAHKNRSGQTGENLFN